VTAVRFRPAVAAPGRSYVSVEIGIDSFAAAFTDDRRAVSASDRLSA